MFACDSPFGFREGRIEITHQCARSLKITVVYVELTFRQPLLRPFPRQRICVVASFKQIEDFVPRAYLSDELTFSKGQGRMQLS